MRLEAATPADRERLALVRAQEWRGALTAAEFAERNRRLYAHPYGRARVKTWCLREKGELVTSLDTLDIELRSGAGVRPAWLIASVVTPEEHRGKGHASRLLTALFESDPARAQLLFSDIEPAFYERFGFQATSFEEATVSVGAGTGGAVRSISMEAFVVFQREERRRRTAREPGSAWLEPEALRWDWKLERYRFFCALRGRPWSGEAAFETDHGHCLVTAPDPVQGRLDALWLADDCDRCRSTAQRQADAAGLALLRYWREWRDGAEGYRQEPMIRWPGRPGVVPGRGAQLGDWW